MSFWVVQFEYNSLVGWESYSTAEHALEAFCSDLRDACAHRKFYLPIVLDGFTHVREWDARGRPLSFALVGVPKSMVLPAIDWLNKDDAL